MRKHNLTLEEITLIESKLAQLMHNEQGNVGVGAFLGGFFGLSAIVTPLFRVALYDDSISYDDLIKKSKELSEDQKDRKLLDNYLKERKYETDKNEIDYKRFREEAKISQPAWSRYCSGANVGAPTETLAKMVSTLKLSDDESFEFISAAGGGVYDRPKQDRELLKEFLRAHGYVKEDNSLDYTQFYRDADILEGTWSKYIHQKNEETSKDTLLKIVLALRMSTKQAVEFLYSAGGGFYRGNRRDMLILAFIDTNYLKLTNIAEIQYKVFDLLNYYLECANSDEFHNLYDF